MTHEELLKYFDETTAKLRKTLDAKNQDYSGQSDNAFANFERSQVIGIDPTTGILVRMLDKLSRVSNLIKVEGKVKDESIQDTLLDLANYAIILSAMIESKKEKEEDCHIKSSCELTEEIKNARREQYYYRRGEVNQM